MRVNITFLFILFILPNLSAKTKESNLTSKYFVEIPDKTSFSSNYKNTSCADLYKGSRHSGLHCKSNDPKLLDDLGVSITKEEYGGSLEKSWPSIKSIDVSSGFNSYPTKKYEINGKILYAAEVDCDEGNSINHNTYRATSTCLVGIKIGKKRNFEYYIITLTNDISGVKVSTKESAIEFISSNTDK